EQNLANNTSTLTTQAQGAALGPQVVGPANGQEAARPVLYVRPVAGGLVQLEVQAEAGTAYNIETSIDLVHWELLTDTSGWTPRSTVLDRVDGELRFYRARRAGDQTASQR